MPWQDEAIPTLRIIINDMDTVSPAYSDIRLEQTLVVAAKLIMQEINFTNIYTVSVENLTISPDPVDTSDLAYTNMMILKAACLVDFSTFRTKAAMEGIKAVLGPANLQVAGNLAGFNTLLDKGPCATFNQLRNEMLWGDINMVKAILSPFSGNKFDARYLQDYYSQPDDRSLRR